jgi:SulP family sulfate permease
MLNVASLRRAWLAERADAVAWLLTFGLVLLLGVDSGIMAGVMVSLTTLLWRSSRPHIAVLGRVPGTHHFRNRERHTVECLPGVLLLRVDESLYFGNARQVRRPCCPGWGRGWGATGGAGDECGQPGGYHGIVHAGRAGSGLATSGGGSASGRNQGAGGGYPAAGRLAARFAGQVHLSTQAAWQAWPDRRIIKSEQFSWHESHLMLGSMPRQGYAVAIPGADRFAGSACNQIAVACSHPR